MSLLVAPPAVDSKRIPPSPRIIDALRNIGYSLESALADLIDNSVDAGAKTVLVRFVRSDDSLVSVLVVDDGGGMSEKALDRAMQFGGEKRYRDQDLGMYGMGLKTASLSQAGSLSVLSRSRSGSVVGRRWTVDNARRDWSCDILDRKKSTEFLARAWSERLTLEAGGTVVRWDEVNDFDKADGAVDRYLARAYESIAHHFGLHFHRLISARRLRLIIDTEDANTGLAVPSMEIRAIDPFAYPKTGKSGYPKKFSVRLPGVGTLPMLAHVWPARSKIPEYRLGGKAAASQGFYFYRNDRLIQAGGWDNVAQDGEPHLSLARVAIEIPRGLESYFHVQYNKSDVRTPRSFVEAVRSSRAADGTTFQRYLEDADRVYRTKPPTMSAIKPMIPMGEGFRTDVARRHAEYASPVPGRSLQVEWASLPLNTVFEMDKDEDILILNARFRQVLNAGRRGTAADAPLVKALLYLLLEPEFRVERDRKTRRKKIQMYNAVLLAAIKAMKGRT